MTPWQTIIDQLEQLGLQFGPGLTDTEVSRVERQYGFRFPPDLREFVQAALPCGDKFPDWRSGDDSVLRDWLNLPREGVLFDIEHNGFWLPEWGPRSKTLAEALRTADEMISAAPKLIPVHLHRMMPDEPRSPGNPVFSVHQTDIICYGFDLADFLRHEFKLPHREPWPGHIRPIRFWDIDRFCDVRWARGDCAFDNRRGLLP
ncbi:MAG: hypothetical protein ACKV0T_16530 [Planctomycetales bacterium]